MFIKSLKMKIIIDKKEKIVEIRIKTLNILNELDYQMYSWNSLLKKWENSIDMEFNLKRSTWKLWSQENNIWYHREKIIIKFAYYVNANSTYRW